MTTESPGVEKAETREPARGDRGAAILSLQRRAGNHAVHTWIERAAMAEAGIEVPPVARSALRAGPGAPLPPGHRRSMESRFEADLQDVRVHKGEDAGRSAEALGAVAYSVGRDIVFAPGRYAPETPAGQDLLMHELTHVVYQAGDLGLDNRLYMQPDEEAGETSGTPEAVSIPGTGVTAFPTFAGTASLLGARIPLPASLRLTNALSAGAGPGFVLDVEPRRLVLNLLEGVDLSSTVRPGTPPGREGLPANQQRTRLLQPSISLDLSSGRLRGSGVLSVESEYPTALKGPSNIDVDISSTEIGQFRGRLGYGPLNADFRLRLHYDTSRLSAAASPVLNLPAGFEGLWESFQSILRSSIPGLDLSGHSQALRTILQSIQTGQIDTASFVRQTIGLVGATVRDDASLSSLREALRRFANELSHPGFTLSGSASLGPVPLTVYGARASTTVPRQRPLLGAPTSFPVQYGAAGVVVAPAGSIFETPVPALGAVGGAFGERSGIYGSGGVLPSLSLSAVSGGEPLINQFPVYLYAEITGVTRVSDGFELGVRLTAQVNTPQLFGPAAEPQTAEQRLQSSLNAYQESRRESGTPAAPVPNVGLTVFGRFSAF